MPKYTNLIIDGSNLMHRSYWVPGNEYGKRTISVFLYTIRKYIKEYKPDHVYCAWDKKLDIKQTNFRKELDGEYKSQRDPKVASKVYEDADSVCDFLESIGITNLYPRKCEADDIIAFLCQHLQGNNLIITADHDLLQLVNNNVHILLPSKQEIVNLNNFETITGGIPKDKFLLYKCLIGDKSDNVKGVPRVGKKTAEKIINGDIELTPEQKEIVSNNMSILDLSVAYTKVEGEHSILLEQIKTKPTPSLTKFEELCNLHGLQNFIIQKHEWVSLIGESNGDSAKSITAIFNTFINKGSDLHK